MKKHKIVFWITTGILSAMMIFSAFNYITNEEMNNAFVHLGFPSYFRIELAIAKFLGAVALILPISAKLKEVSYVGFAITFISAIIAHLASGDPVSIAIMPLIFLLLLVVSYVYLNKLQSLIKTA